MALTPDTVLGDPNDPNNPRNIGLLPLLRPAPPPVVGLSPSPAPSNPPVLGPRPETPTVRPAEDRYNQMVTQGAPRLHGVKEVLDVLGQGLFPRIEAAIPGSPGNYKGQLATARQAAQDEAAQNEQQSEQAYRKYEMGKPEVVSPGSYVGTPETGFQQVGEPKQPAPEKETAFDLWKAQNPNAPVQDWLKLQGPQARPVNDAFHEWLQDPQSYEKFQKAMEGIKKDNGGMFGSPYASVRALDMAALYAPEMFPQALAGASKALGWNMTPEQQAAAVQNFNANLATYQGNKLGSRSHLNPTAVTETQAQMADKVLNEVPGVRTEIQKISGSLGPISGRAITGFLAGTLGTTGNQNLDEALGELRTDWPMLMSATSKMHIGTQKAIDDLEKTNNISGSSSRILTGFLDSVEKWARQAQREGKNVGGTANNEGPQPGEQPVYVNGQLTGYTRDGKTYSRVVNQ